MKERIIVFFLLTLAALLTGCSNRRYSKIIPQQYMQEAFDFPIPDNILEEEDYIDDDTIEYKAVTDSKILKIYDKTYEKVSSYFGIKKEQPELVHYKDYLYSTESAYFEPKSGKIFVAEKLAEDFEICLAHEIIHYLSCNDTKTGFVDYKDPKSINEFLFFNEGATQALAEKILGKPKASYIYSYETLIAKIFQMSIGETAFEEAYFKNDTASLKEVFKKISNLYPDYYTESGNTVSQEDAYFRLMAYPSKAMLHLGIEMNIEERIEFTIISNSIIEEALIIANESGKKVPAQKLIKEYIKINIPKLISAETADMLKY